MFIRIKFKINNKNNNKINYYYLNRIKQSIIIIINRIIFKGNKNKLY
jgi:hypothetical protein